jgi:hypothetical protein
MPKSWSHSRHDQCPVASAVGAAKRNVTWECTLLLAGCGSTLCCAVTVYPADPADRHLCKRDTWGNEDHAPSVQFDGGATNCHAALAGIDVASQTHHQFPQRKQCAKCAPQQRHKRTLVGSFCAAAAGAVSHTASHPSAAACALTKGTGWVQTGSQQWPVGPAGSSCRKWLR